MELLGATLAGAAIVELLAMTLGGRAVSAQIFRKIQNWAKKPTAIMSRLQSEPD